MSDGAMRGYNLFVTYINTSLCYLNSSEDFEETLLNMKKFRMAIQEAEHRARTLEDVESDYWRYCVGRYD